jgi:23S rRNA (uracil1939-C5)-methyltransferase
VPPALPHKDDLVEIDVERLALGGRGLGRWEGVVAFVDDALPGDRVVARVLRRKPRYLEARSERIVTPSPYRVEAPCAHYRERVCGGCRVQDLAYERQLEAKAEQVRETLEHLGGLGGFELAPIAGSPERFRYRNKMEFTFHPGPDGEPILGLHRRGDFRRAFPLEECWLASPLTNQLVRFTRDFARARAWAAYHPTRHDGVVRFLVVRHLPLSDQAMVNLVATREDVEGIEAWARGAAALDARVRSVVLNRNSGRANVALGEPGRERVLAGGRTVEEHLLGLVFEVSANTFLQTNSRQAEALYRAAMEEAELTGRERVLDLYCGAGTLTLPLARAAREAVGVEVVASAVREAQANARRNGVENASFLEGEARDWLRRWPHAWKPEVAVVDPPRAGLHAKVVRDLAALAPRRIVYVSCNPASLARDLASFVARGYRLERVRPFDLFPHTPHVECVARLTRLETVPAA